MTALPGHDGRNYCIHRGEVGIVPRRQHEHDAERLAPDETPEPFTLSNVEVHEHPGRDVDHVVRSLLETPPDLERGLRDRPPDLPRELGGEPIGPLDHQRDHPAADPGSVGDAYALPLALRRDGTLEDRVG